MTYYKALENITETENGWKFHCINVFTGMSVDFEIEAIDGGQICDPCQDAQDWANGKLIQDAFRYLYPAEREMLITGMLPEDWENMDDLGE